MNAIRNSLVLGCGSPDDFRSMSSVSEVDARLGMWTLLIRWAVTTWQALEITFGLSDRTQSDMIEQSGMGGIRGRLKDLSRKIESSYGNKVYFERQLIDADGRNNSSDAIVIPCRSVQAFQVKKRVHTPNSPRGNSPLVAGFLHLSTLQHKLEDGSTAWSDSRSLVIHPPFFVTRRVACCPQPVNYVVSTGSRLGGTRTNSLTM